ncbi:MAG: nitrogen fixation protein NifH, partial [Lachnospiraceae bacterium]|nr:nitrogen fixation protein NifH [Lachnospiraceae bacterium]
RNVENETEKVQAFAKERGLEIIGEVPRANEINYWEDQGKTVIEGNPDSEVSKVFFDLAKMLLEEE